MASGIVGIGPTWLGRRQMGFKNPLGTKNHIYEQMYSNILPYGSWDHTFNNMYTSVHGGVFCLEFSPEGSLLVAACEKRSILMFDPLTHKRIHSVENAHLDCVNCVRFLDSRSFATCSDDFTVAIWDARNLSQKVRSLKGHSNWVKNIEYSPQDGLLVTSGFDGSILTWEMNTYREEGIVYNKVFSTNGLMRTRLTPDATKMVICTTGGYLIIIHNLDLNTMSQDLDGFKPNMYRLMQLSQTILPVASDFTNLFRGQGKRNRVEFITDFPEGDDAEVVSSLQIHPDGHCAISRNVNNNEKSEWSCIHNIEERLSSDESDFTDDEGDEIDGCKMISWPGNSTSISTTPSYIIQHDVVESERRSSEAMVNAGTSIEQRDLSVSPSDVWEALVAIQEARIRRESDRVATEMSVGQMFRRQAAETGARDRPVNFDSQIFVTRILPNLSSNSDSEEGLHGLRSSAPVFRRNMSINTTEIMARDVGQSHPSASPSRNCRSRSRKKLPVRQRYGSLYRRSLVGQYDRTSILRKPIYNHGVIEFKLRKLKKSFELNTNYELNETRRLQNELDTTRQNSVARNGTSDQACCSKARNGEEGSTRPSPNRIKSETKNGTRRTCSEVNASSSSGSGLRLWQGLNRCKRNSNSICENVNDVEGSVNSRRGENCSRTPDKNRGRGKEKVVGAVEARRRQAAPKPSRNSEDTVDHEEVIEAEDAEEERSRRETSDGAERQATAAGVSGPPTEAPETRSSGGKTILMGVFRAGNEDGIRGTSMRKHNVAAVTVSSPTRTGSNSSMGGGGSSSSSSSSNGGHLLERRTSRYNNNSKSKSHQSTNSNGANKNSNRSKSNIHCSSQGYPIVPVNRKIHQNAKRLTHYVEEPNLGRGFIKELCVSPDGRIICSPFGNGIRLLSFSPTVQDVFHCYPASPPIPLHELTLNIAHTDIVVSTKFSPFHNLLVSGCLSGKIVYYQPFL